MSTLTLVTLCRSTSQSKCKYISLTVCASVGKERKRMPSSSFFTVEADEPIRTTIHTRMDEFAIDAAPIQSGRLHELTARGRTLKHAFHPILSQGQAWIGEKHVNTRMQSSFIVCHSQNTSLMQFIGSKHISSSRRASPLFLRYSESKAISSKGQGRSWFRNLVAY